MQGPRILIQDRKVQNRQGSFQSPTTHIDSALCKALFALFPCSAQEDCWQNDYTLDERRSYRRSSSQLSGPAQENLRQIGLPLGE